MVEQLLLLANIKAMSQTDVDNIPAYIYNRFGCRVSYPISGISSRDIQKYDFF